MNETILVVDDEREIADLLEIYLEAARKFGGSMFEDTIDRTPTAFRSAGRSGKAAFSPSLC